MPFDDAQPLISPSAARSDAYVEVPVGDDYMPDIRRAME